MREKQLFKQIVQEKKDEKCEKSIIGSGNGSGYFDRDELR